MSHFKHSINPSHRQNKTIYETNTFTVRRFLTGTNAKIYEQKSNVSTNDMKTYAAELAIPVWDDLTCNDHGYIV